ncbi:MAG: BACON domain-containing protein [Tannerella sp.]|nr:BACON domain-containing protein [Tannerella sp.]
MPPGTKALYEAISPWSYFGAILEEGETLQLSVSPDSLGFTADGGQNSIQIVSNINWRVVRTSLAQGWLSVYPATGSGNGTIQISATHNTDTVARRDTLTISGGGTEQKVIIEQGTASLTVSPDSIGFGAGGGQDSIQVVSNINWSVVRAGATPWLTVTRTVASSNGTVRITTMPNTGVTTRRDTLTVSGGGIEQKVIVMQEAAPPSLTVSSDSIGFGAGGGQDNIQVVSNINWSVVRAGDAPWLTLTPTAASGNGTVHITAMPNTDVTARRDTLTVFGGGIARKVIITQEAVPSLLTVSTDSIGFASGGGQDSISVASNIDWTVVRTGAAPWLTVSPASGSGNDTLHITVAPNTGVTARRDTLTVSGGGMEREIIVTQEAAPPSLSLLPDSIGFPAAGGSQYLAVLSNVAWTEVSSEAWVTVSPATGSGDGALTVTAAANTGEARAATLVLTGSGLTQTVTVTQESAQQVIVNPSTPSGNQGTIDISLQIPVDEDFAVTFTVSLPAGFLLNPEATALVADLLSRFELEIKPNGAGGWLFAIRPKLSTLAADETEYRQLVQIAYTMDGSVVKGEYEVKLNDVDLTLNGGQVIHQDEITAPVTVLISVGNAAIDAGDVRYAGGVLTVNTPVAERITVYSIGGSVMYQAQKAAGEATFDLRSLPKGVFIAKGSSGWTEKIVVSD